MKNRTCAAVIAALALLLAVAGAATAQEPEPAEAFTHAEGYEVLNETEIEERINALLPETDSVFLPSGSLSAPAKAALALAVTEGEVPRARHHLTITLVPGTTLMLVQLDRYNLGPAIRQQEIESHGEENVGHLEEFGIGAHTSLRLALTPVMGHEAAVISAARREITDTEAGEALCLLGPCLTPKMLIDDAEFLSNLEEVNLSAAGEYEAVTDGLPSLATLLDGLAERSGLILEGNEAQLMREEPFVVAEAMIETNLAQESAVDGVMRVGELMDDSVGAIWARLATFGMWEVDAPVYGATAYECRRGESESGLCL